MLEFKKVERSVIDHKYIQYFQNIGLEIDTVIDNIRIIVEKNGDVLENVFSNRSYQMLSTNIFLESVIFEEVNKYLFEHFKDSIIFEDYVSLDLKSLIAFQNSIIERPEMQKPSELVEGIKDNLESENSYIRIAKFENEMLLDSHRSHRKGHVIVFEGILPFSMNIKPFSEDDTSNHIWSNSFCTNHPFCIIGFCKEFHSIQANHILWLNSDVINELDLSLDIFGNGLRAINNEGEVILVFRHWKDSLVGNGSSFVGQDSNISKMEGCDLMLREDYFSILEKLFPDLSFYTSKFKVTV